MMVIVFQAKTAEIFEALNLARGAWLINQITTQRWGNELMIHALYNPEEAHTQLQITFKDCRKTVWDAFGIEDEVEEKNILHADVIGMEIGESQHRKPAVITTDLFEIAITYGELLIQKDW